MKWILQSVRTDICCGLLECTVLLCSFYVNTHLIWWSFCTGSWSGDALIVNRVVSRVGNLEIDWRSLCCCFFVNFSQVKYSFTLSKLSFSPWIIWFWVLKCKVVFVFEEDILILWLTIVWMCSCFKQVNATCSSVLMDSVSFRMELSVAFLNYWEIFLLEFEMWNDLRGSV